MPNEEKEPLEEGYVPERPPKRPKEEKGYVPPPPPKKPPRKPSSDSESPKANQ